jgi:serine/threonine-protein kinase SRPK3
MAEALTC